LERWKNKKLAKLAFFLRMATRISSKREKSLNSRFSIHEIAADSGLELRRGKSKQKKKDSKFG
jgi:hypothetical protein